MKKAIVFIDGSNFYYRLKHIIKKGDGNTSLLDFNYQEFSKNLIKNNIVDIINVYASTRNGNANKIIESKYGVQYNEILQYQ